eukprot:415577_1
MPMSPQNLHLLYTSVCEQLLENQSPSLWNEFITLVKQKQSIIYPQIGTIPTIRHINSLSAIKLSECHGFDANIIVYSMRYGDPFLFKSALTKDLNAIQHRYLIKVGLLTNYLMIMSSLIPKQIPFILNTNMLFKWIRIYSITALPYEIATLFVIDHVINSSQIQNMHRIVRQLFITLFLIYKISQAKSSLFCLGVLMIFASKQISQYLNTSNVSHISANLQKVLQLIQYPYSDINSDELYTFSKELKQWKFIRSKGKNFVSELKGTSCDEYCMYLFGKCIANGIILDGYTVNDSIDALTKAICMSDSLYIRTLLLRQLSSVCAEHGQYGMAFKTLYTAYKYCFFFDLTIKPSFVKKVYFEKKKDIQKKLNKFVCCYCKKKGKLKSCTGCMVQMYCSILCQKKDWKKKHRNKCGRFWLKYYKLLKDGYVFAAVQNNRFKLI